jgi:hypothetical protein
MGIIKDTTASFERVRGYGNQMKSLLSRHGVHNIDDLKRVARNSPFKSEVAALWEGILKAEGGKVTLTLLLSTIAIAMGGVGIAAGGSAIGLPLLVILAPAGYFGGQELDSEGYTKTVVDTFRMLLHNAQRLETGRYTGMVADKFKEILQKVQELEPEGRNYRDGLIDMFKRFREKTGKVSS